jgi:hypothetical protein
MTSRRGAKTGNVESEFAKVAEILTKARGVTLGGSKGFGSGALKVDGKIFAILSSKNQFVVKLSKDRVDELVASGAAAYFEPCPGKSMKEWVVTDSAGAD